MLDKETKNRIDTARIILVGKVPNPQSQVEQITIALIYKFMDDMDNESLEMGGKATFFSGDFEKFKWKNIFDAKLGGVDVLNLYSEAITNLNLNPNIPQLFRDIFKNAYLPYRDPETLKLFLKTINEFHYDHSEKLGDAFEYLLSVLGSQGDAGMFRTPRHIIDFIVSVVEPQKTDSICDPACGTAGFLISAFKYILESNTKKVKGDLLTPDDKKKLMANIVGLDISPDMVRLSLVNMYLHNFTVPKIYEYDTLTSDERWNDYFDVILANPPFMSPKGGIIPHKKFSLQVNRSEVLFVDYIAEHINPIKGRAGVIVPEGIIFQSANAYKQLRKSLVEDKYLYAVVSLPAGIFQPYAGVKTSILFMDRVIAKKSNEILFVKIENDGFDLGAQRNPIEKNDLPEAINYLKKYKDCILKNKEFSTINKNIFLVDKDTLAEVGDYNFSLDRYRESDDLSKSKWDMVKLSDVCELNPKKTELQDLSGDILVSFVPMADINENSMYFKSKSVKKLTEVINGYTYFRNNDVLIAKVTPCFENGKGGIATNLENEIGFGSSEFYVLRANENTLPIWIYTFLTSDKFRSEGKQQMTGTGGLQRIPRDFVANFKIPLPPIEIQKEIVNKIESYQKIIDGSKQIVQNYKHEIEINPTWGMIKLGDVSEFIRGPFGGSLKKEIFVKEGFKIYEQKNAIKNNFEIGNYFIDKEKFEEMRRFELLPDDIIISCSGTMGKIAIAPKNLRKGIINQALLKLTPNLKLTSSKFLKMYLESDRIQNKYFRDNSGAAIQNVASVKYLKEIPFPDIPLEIQEKIVNEMEQEYNLIQSTEKLKITYENKIKAEIDKLWQE